MSEKSQRTATTRPSTREGLLDTAEQLFAESGIEAVSLRAVGQRAGQRNNSVAQYHFGSRQGLVRAIIERRSAPIEARRRELLDQLHDRVREAVSVADLVRTFVLPLAEALGTPAAPTWYLRFLAQVVAHGDEESTKLLATQVTALREVRHELRELLRDQPSTVFARRQRWMAQLTLQVLADHERETAAATSTGSIDEVVTDLVAMLVALLTAPVTSPDPTAP